MLRQTPETVVKEINRLLDDYTEREIADILNSQDMISGEGKRFNRSMVARIRSNYGLDTRYSRLRTRGMLTLREIATRLDISAATAKTWRRVDRLRSHRYNDKESRLNGDCRKRSPGIPSQLARGGRTRSRKRHLRHRHAGSCLSEDSLFDSCGCSRCLGGCVFGGAFPLTGRRAVLAAASASKRLSSLRSVTVVLLIDHSCGEQVPPRGGRRRLRSPSL